ncbi:uncharacterized protein LOC115627972 [Scaptodrosophila lebanonensis]|uniref:Uncharacterized protein LOC115627972 n=1 Tax=Drosophila lebanonensis TaxID=7225 RepID=A0A6J2TXV1_DROLE|nr:uncharacterized protein LOC115627972 [Scaptodrosophila lebanonensis]
MQTGSTQPAQSGSSKITIAPMQSVLTTILSEGSHMTWSLGPQESVERRVLKVLLHLETDFRSYYNLWRRGMVLQREAADMLWGLTQRYMIIMKADPTCICPQNYAIEPEEVLIAEYNVHYMIIQNSNEEQNFTLRSMRHNVVQFRKSCNKLDLTKETPFIMGDTFHKPIKFFIELVDELFNYFYSGYLKLDYMANQLDPLDLKPLEEYRELLNPSEEFEEYLMLSLTYCKCLVPEPCPRFVPDKCEETPPQTKQDLKKSRCLARRAEMMGETGEVKDTRPSSKTSIRAIKTKANVIKAYS